MEHHSAGSKFVHDHREGTPGAFDQLPDELRRLLDPSDPDLDVITESIDLMRIAGFEVDTQEGIQACIASARRRVAQLEAQSGPAARRLQCQLADEYHAQMAEWRERESRVYYIRRADNLVKIGFSTNVEVRMRDLGVWDLLVTEPGGRALERERHEQFADLRVRGEWFRYERPLIEHVISLLDARDTPVVGVEPPKAKIRPSFRGPMITTAEAAKLAGVEQVTIRGWGSKSKVPVTRYPDGWDLGEIVSYRDTRKVYHLKPIDWAS